MKLTRNLISLLIMLFSTTASAADIRQQVEASLSLPYQSVLPGVPFDMNVTVKNASAASVSVGISAHLIVTLADGTKITPKQGHILDPQISSHPDPWVELAPGEIRQWTVDWYTSTPSMFHEPAFSAPGEYDVALELSAFNPPPNYVGSIRTSSAHLTRVAPAGEDDALWAKMEAAAHTHWSDDSFANSHEGRALLREILLTHPTSGYYPYALLLEPQFERRTAGENDITKALDAAERFHQSPAYPHLLLRAADVALSIGMHAVYDRNSTMYQEYLPRAARLFDEALKKAPGGTIQAVADRGKRLAEAQIDIERARGHDPQKY